MKDIKDFIKSKEGGYVNDPQDSGGATNKGVTLRTFRAVCGAHKTITDLKRITSEEWATVFQHCVWQPIAGEKIKSPAISAVMADFAWHSGAATAVKFAQSVCTGLIIDGVAGAKTVATLNRQDPGAFVKRYCDARRGYLLRVAGFNTENRLLLEQARKSPDRISVAMSRNKNKRFIKGWLYRVNELEQWVNDM